NSQVNLKTTRRTYEGYSYQSSKLFPTKTLKVHTSQLNPLFSYQQTRCHNIIMCEFLYRTRCFKKVQLMTILIARARSAEERQPLEQCKKPGVFNAKCATSGVHTITEVVPTINSATVTTRLTTQQLARVISFKHQRRNARTHIYLPKLLRV